MCILYARVVFALSTTKKKVIFVVIRTFLLIDLSVCARRVSLLMMKMQSKNETHVQTNVQTNRRSLFYRFRVFSARL